jgi:hypothetical protein
VTGQKESDGPVGRAVDAIGRALTAMDNEWDDGGPEDVLLAVRRGKHYGSWEVTVTGEEGWSVDAVVIVTVSEVRKEER